MLPHSSTEHKGDVTGRRVGQRNPSPARRKIGRLQRLDAAIAAAVRFRIAAWSLHRESIRGRIGRCGACGGLTMISWMHSGLPTRTPSPSIDRIAFRVRPCSVVEGPMDTALNRVIVTISGSSSTAMVHHRDFPEIRAEGRRPGKPRRTWSTSWPAPGFGAHRLARETVDHAIADVKAFVAQKEDPARP